MNSTSSMSIICIIIAFLLHHKNVLGYDGELISFNWNTTNCTIFPFTNGTNFYKCGILEYCNVGTDGKRVGYRQYGSNNSCFSPGPLIRVESGKKYLLSFYNNIPGSKSNIHTHGFHISGDGNSDNSLRGADSDGCIHYVWDVPINHLGGTHWYHSHKHEYSLDQVSKGANGMIIVEDNYNTLFPENIKNNNTQMNRLISFFQNEYQFVASSINFDWNGNGRRRGGVNVNIIQNEWTRIRLSISAPVQSHPTVNFLLAALSDTFTCPDSYIIAFDGVYTMKLPMYKLPQRITGSSRIDIALRCTFIGQSKLTYDDATIVTFNVISGTPKDATPFIDDELNNYKNNKTWSPVRPYYLRDLRNETVTNNYTISLGDLKINGQKWDPLVPLATFKLNDLNEMDLKFTNQHPIHTHVQHMQIVENCGSFKLGEFYDTIASDVSDCKVRISFDDYDGINLLHCHDLEHEDRGMMGWFNILNDTSSTIIKNNPDVDDRQCFLLLPTQAPTQKPTSAPIVIGPPSMPASVPSPTPIATCTTCRGLLGLSGQIISRTRFGRCIQRCSLFSSIRIGLGWKCGSCPPPSSSTVSTITEGVTDKTNNIIILPSICEENESGTCSIRFKCIDTLGSTGYYIRRYHNGEDGPKTCQDICQSANVLKLALSMGGWECGSC